MPIEINPHEILARLQSLLAQAPGDERYQRAIAFVEGELADARQVVEVVA